MKINHSASGQELRVGRGGEGKGQLLRPAQRGTAMTQGERAQAMMRKGSKGEEANSRDR